MLTRLSILRRRVLLHRRGLAALFAALAVVGVVEELRPAAPALTGVVVAARAIPAGRAVSSADLTTVSMNPDLIPGGAYLRVRDVIGHTLASPVSVGEPITAVRILGKPLREAYPGLVATPVRISDAQVAALLKPGDEVDVVVADPQNPNEPTRLLARGARVIAVPPPDEGLTSGAEGGLVLLAVSPEQSNAVAGAPVAGYVSVVWSR